MFREFPKENIPLQMRRPWVSSTGSRIPKGKTPSADENRPTTMVITRTPDHEMDSDTGLRTRFEWFFKTCFIYAQFISRIVRYRVIQEESWYGKLYWFAISIEKLTFQMRSPWVSSTGYMGLYFGGLCGIWVPNPIYLWIQENHSD